jgi:uncharacterized DUF497 family protein
VQARWHPSSEDHIARHGVTWSEVEEAMEPPTITDLTNRGTLRVLGQTYAGRVVAMIVAPDDVGGTCYVITARTADDGERRTYQRRGKKG